MKTSSVHAAPGSVLVALVNPNECPMRNGMYLRGGMTYHAFSNQIITVEYSRENGEVEVARISYDAGNTTAVWMAKSYHIDDVFLGVDYDNFITPYDAFPYDTN